MSGSAGGGNTIQEFLVSIAYRQSGQREFRESMVVVANQAVELGKSVAAAALSVTQAVAAIAASLESLYFASQRTGASVEGIKAFSFAVEQMGGTAAEARGSLENLGRFLRTNPGGEGFIQSLGVSTRNAKGELRDTTAVLADLGGKLRAMPAFQAASYGSVLGIDERTLMALRAGVGEFSGEYRAMYAAAGLDAQKAAKDSHAFMVELRTLGGAVDILREKVTTSFTRRMTEDIRRFRVALVSNFGTVTEALVPIGRIVEGVADAIGKFAGSLASDFRNLITWYSGLSTSSKTLIIDLAAVVAAWAALNVAFSLSPVGRVVALGAALYGLWEDYKTWRDGGKSLIDWDAWKPGIDAAIAGMKPVQSAFGDLWKAIREDLLPSLGDLGGENGFSKAFGSLALRAITRFRETTINLIGDITHLVQMIAALSRGDVTGAGNIAKGIWNDWTKGSDAKSEGGTPEGFQELLEQRRREDGGGDFIHRWLYGTNAIAPEKRGAILQNAVKGTPVPPGLADALIAQESGWNATAQRSGGSDLGLGQILASTGAKPGYGMEPISREDALDPMKNARFAMQYFYRKAKANGMTDAEWSTTAGQRKALRLYNGGGDANYDSNVLGRVGRTGTPFDVISNGPADPTAMEKLRGLRPGVLQGLEQQSLGPDPFGLRRLPPQSDLERVLGLPPGSRAGLQGLGTPAPLTPGGMSASTTNAPTLNQTTTITVQGGNADTGRQVLDAQRSVNQTAIRNMQGAAW